MRHTIPIACGLLLCLLSAQGTAVADGFPIPALPPPMEPCSRSECEEAMASAADDCDAMVTALAKCQGKTEEEIRQTSRISRTCVIKKTTTSTTTSRKRTTGNGTAKRAAPPAAPSKGTDGRDGMQGVRGSQGPQGPQGPKGDRGERGADGASIMMRTVTVKPNKECPAGCERLQYGFDANRNGKLDDKEVQTVILVRHGRDGKDGDDGSNGRPGQDGNTRIQVGLGLRYSSVYSSGRPPGVSLSPQGEALYWLSDIWGLKVGFAWAWGEDRNMVVTTQLCRRGLDSWIGFCGGIQYQAWNLEGNRALWHSGLAVAALQLVPVDAKWFDVTIEAGPMLGFDGYDKEMQFAYGATGILSVSGKF